MYSSHLGDINQLTHWLYTECQCVGVGRLHWSLHCWKAPLLHTRDPIDAKMLWLTVLQIITSNAFPRGQNSNTCLFLLWHLDVTGECMYPQHRNVTTALLLASNLHCFHTSVKCWKVNYNKSKQMVQQHKARKDYHRCINQSINQSNTTISNAP